MVKRRSDCPASEIRPFKSCPTPIGSENCTNAKSSRSCTALMSKTLNTPRAGTVTVSVPLLSAPIGLPDQFSFSWFSLPVFLMLSTVKTEVFFAGSCCHFTLSAVEKSSSSAFSISFGSSWSEVLISPLSFM
ncbi:hypothetical protein D3C87_1701480 [compost metagenome]